MKPSQARKVDKVIDMPHTEYAPVGLDNIHEFIKSYTAMMTLALIAFIAELVRVHGKLFKQSIGTLYDELFDTESVQTYWTLVKRN